MEDIKEDRAFYASSAQRDVLLQLLTHPSVESSFFLTGGTALAVFYLHHRVSDDLDFFSVGRPSLSDIEFWIRTQWVDACSKVKEGPNFLSFLIRESKVEFVIDPLSNKEERSASVFENGKRLIIDNVDNIVSNKFGAMVSRQEPKDFVDFYFLLKEFPSLKLEEIYQNARLKDAIFDDSPTAAFQLEEGLALMKENPGLLPAIRGAFNSEDFYSFHERIAEWIYLRTNKVS